MKRKRNVSRITLSLVTGLLGLIVVSACGGGGGGGKGKIVDPLEPDPAKSEEMAQQASSSLDEGEVATALEQYDDALELNPDNANAAFGSALTRLIMLSEADPTNTILRRLGQKEMKVTDLVGTQSYLAEENLINQTTVALTGLEGSFFGKAYLRAETDQGYEENPALTEEQMDQMWDEYDDLNEQYWDLEYAGAGEAELAALRDRMNAILDEIRVPFSIESQDLVISIWNVDRSLEMEMEFNVWTKRTNTETGQVVEETSLVTDGGPVDILISS